MHTIPELGTSVPAFLAKLWKLVEGPETDDLICWSPNGRSFFIRNQAQFARELLPHYYKHNNMASFVRQLNMYGFHKKVSVELGGLKCDKDEMEFAHQFFCKGHPYLVEHIKRKIASSKGQDPALAPIKPELMNKMLTEVRSMRGRQEHLDSRLGAMKRENEALWRELAMLRQKHLKQQQIVNKLIHFLVTLVQPSRSGGLSVKRRYPLMINDSTRQRCKQSKLSKPEASPTGPVIHELDASEPDLDSQYIVAEMLDNSNPSIESPDHREGDIGEDNMEPIELYDDSVQLHNDVRLVNPQELDMKKKRGCRGKKKRKNKVPVKILIPPTEEGEEPREETHLLEVPLDDPPVAITLMEQPKIVPVSKPVPVATVRSSKLAAMAANMKKSAEAEIELELESSMDTEEDVQDADSTLVKLGDILIVPEIISEGNVDENGDFVGSDESSVTGNEVNILTAAIAANGVNDGMGVPEKAESPTNRKNKTERYNQPDNADSNRQKEMTQDMSKPNGAQMINQATNKGKSNEAGSSSSTKDLSLSCVNSSGVSYTAYRLGPMEEVDTHLETMQSELDNLRELLRGEGYSIDANTLLGLFGAEDPMSFGVPVNPELNPHAQCDKEIEELEANGLDGLSGGESMNSNGNGGELMAYNPAPSLLDFDDDIFLAASSSSPVTSGTGDPGGNNFYTGDPLDLEDSKASILESLVANDVNNTS